MNFKLKVKSDRVIWDHDSARSELRSSAVALAKDIRASITRGSGVSAPGSAPKGKTGTLRRSIGFKSLKSPRIGFRVGARRGGADRINGFYAHFLEFKTVKMDARPFVGPALERKRGRVVADMLDAAERSVRVIA